MEKTPKILYVSAEVSPFAASGGLADVASALPISLRARGVDIRVVMPLYRCIGRSLRDTMTHVCSLTVPVAWRQEGCRVMRAERRGVTYYFIENERYFGRPELYGYYDDGERFAFFCRAVCEILPHLDFFPDVLHANDWQCALSVIYLRQFYRTRPAYSHIRSVYTIHNIEYQGIYRQEAYTDLFGLRSDLLGDILYHGQLNLTKGAVVCAERVTTVSPRYAQEICTPGYSEGLHHILGQYRYKLCGILNGIDEQAFDPRTDRALPVLYGADDPEGKAFNKAALVQELGLPSVHDSFVIAMVSRLVAHKGMDLVCCAVREILRAQVQLVVLGTGDGNYEQFFRDLQAAYPHQVRAILRFDRNLSRRIYAGSDLLLMPSRSEPCGLSQMIASRYGCVPLVRETGGLADTVRPYDRNSGEGNGFTFSRYDAGDLLHAVWEAFGVYRYEREKWNALVRKIMEIDFSWNRSAASYLHLYSETANC